MKIRARSSADRALASGAKGRRFKSCRAHAVGLVFALLLLAPSSARARPYLASPRAEALGGAASPILEDAHAGAFSPAGLAFLPQNVVQVTGNIDGGKANAGEVALGFAASRRSTFSGAFSQFGNGRSRVSAAYARLEREDFAFGFGANVNIEEGSGSDRVEGILGLRKNSALSGINASFTLDHIGGSNVIPIEARLGLSASRLFKIATFASVTSEVVYREGGDVFPRVGVELWGGNIGALRFGFDGEQAGTSAAWSAGFGVHHKGAVLDFAYRFADGVPLRDEPSRITVGISYYFGGRRGPRR